MSDRNTTLEDAVDEVLEAAAILDVVFDQVKDAAVATQDLIQSRGLSNGFYQIWLTETQELGFRRAVSKIVEKAWELEKAYAHSLGKARQAD